MLGCGEGKGNVRKGEGSEEMWGSTLGPFLRYESVVKLPCGKVTVAKLLTTAGTSLH